MRLLYLWNSPGQNTGVGSRSLLQWILPIQGSNLGLTHCRRILYHLSHQGSPLTPEGTYMDPAVSSLEWKKKVMKKTPQANTGGGGGFD